MLLSNKVDFDDITAIFYFGAPISIKSIWAPIVFKKAFESSNNMGIYIDKKGINLV